jgi:phosphoserine phosphatase
VNYIFISAREAGLTMSLYEDARDLLFRHHFTLKKKEDLSPGKVTRFNVEGPDNFDLVKLRTDLIKLSDVHQTDMALMNEDIYLAPKKLFIFDMDSTLIQQEVIDEMAIVHGIGDEVKAITKRAMHGELNFDESLSLRVGLLNKLHKSKMDEICTRLTFMPGAEKLIKAIKATGAKVVIASGGFSFFAKVIGERLSMDEVFSNELHWDGETLTGKVTGEIVNAAFKATLLKKLAAQEKISLNQTVAVGDGANDIPMLLAAGLGFAYHAKPKVRLEANHQLNFGPMNTLLFFLNIPGDHFA